jgi:hypothetical protein
MNQTTQKLQEKAVGLMAVRFLKIAAGIKAENAPNFLPSRTLSAMLRVMGAILATLSVANATSTAISPGQPLTGAISATHLTNTYSFSATAGEAVVISDTGTSGALVPWADLYSPAGTQVGSFHFHGTSGSFPLATAGTYAIRVYDSNGTNTGSYAVGFSFAAGGSGTAITSGQPAGGTISAAAQIDTYTFYATASNAVLISAVSTSGQLIAVADLYSPSGSQLGSANQGDSFSLQLPATGTYTILVYDRNGTNTGNYDVGLGFTAGGSGTAISCGQPISNAISAAGQIDAYNFSATAGEAVLLTGVHTSGHLTAVAELYDPSGNSIGRAFNNIMWYAFPLPATGTYTILVHDSACANTGSYAVGFSFATGACGTPISCGQTISNQISAAAQIDAYTFNATSNEAVVFSGMGTSGSLQLATDLYDPSGNNVGSGLLPTNGLYTILVRSLDGTNTGSYAVGLCFATGRCGTPIECGQTISNAITSAAQSDAYTFYATNGEAVVLTAITSSGTLNADAFLYDPAGNYVGTSWVAGNKSYPLSATGLYTILVHDLMYASTGSYELNLRFSTGRCGTPIECGQPLTGTISTVAQNDAYTFSATAGEAVVLTVMTSSGKLGSFADLYDPSGNLIGNDFQSLVTNSIPLPATGTYTIMVHDLIDVSTGSYAVCVTFTTGRCGTAIACGQTLSSELVSVAQNDAYTFSGTAGRGVVINAMGNSPNLTACADLYDPSGNKVAGNWTAIGSQGTSGSLALTTNGVYSILAHSYTNYATGNYSVSLLDSTPSFGAALLHSNRTSQLQLNGVAGQDYTLLTSTNMALPLSNWAAVLTTNLPGASAVLQDTNATNGRRFYILQLSP